MKITSKKDSLSVMKKLGLNYFDEIVASVDDLKTIEKFFTKNKAKQYIMRSVDKTLGGFCFVKDFEECKKALKDFKGDFMLGVSFRTYEKNIVLLGDIEVKNDGMFFHTNLTARDDEQATHRNIYEEPKYNLSVNFDDDKLWKIRGFQELAKYISEHDLYDVIIEFVVFDIPVGIKKEKVAICELRSNY